jgi:hypothetical protein
VTSAPTILPDSSTPPPAGLPAWPARLLDFFLWLWLLWCVLLLSQFASAPLVHRFPPASLAALAIAGIISQIAGLAAQIFLLKRVPTLSPRPLDTAWMTRRQAVARALRDFLIALPLIFVVNLLWGLTLNGLQYLQPSLQLSPQNVVLLFFENGNPWLLAVIAILIAPVNEELLFRGGIYRFLKSRCRPRLALAITSLLFGLAHANLLEFLPLVLVGALLVRTYERTGRILAPIVFHAAFNAVNIALILLSRTLDW